MDQRHRLKFSSLPLVLAAVLAAAVFVRLPLFLTNVGGSITGKILWFDEAYSVFFAVGRGLGETVKFSGYDTTPALFVVLLHFWSGIFGDGAPALAAFPFLFSLLGVALAYQLAKEFFDRRAGVLAALLVALSPLHIKFATEIRVYSLLFCLAVLSLIFLRRLLENRRTSDGVWWLGVSVLGLYAHYSFLLFFILENLYFLQRNGPDRSRQLRVWLRLLAVGALACLPLPLLFRRWDDFHSAGAALSNLARGFSHGGITSIPTYFAVLAFGERQFYPETWAAAVLAMTVGLSAAAGLAALVWKLRSAPDRSGWRLSSDLLGWMVFGGIVSFMAAGLIYDPKYYLAYTGPAAALLGAGLSRLRGRRLAGAVVGALLLLFLPVTGAFQVTPALAFKYYAPAFAAAMESQERPGDLLLLDNSTDILFRRYYRGRSDAVVFFPRHGSNITDLFERFRYFDYDLMTAADLPTLAGLTAGRDRVWTVDYYPQRTSLQDPGGLKRRWLSQHYLLRQALEFPAGDESPDRQRALLLLYEKE